MKDLWFFVCLFKPYKLWLLAGLFLSLLTSLASISLLTLSGWFITSSAIAGILAPDGVAIAFNFMQPAAEIRALAIIRTLGRYAERVVTHEATFRVLTEIRCWFFEKLIPLSPGRLGMQRSADLLARLTQDIEILDALYLRLLLPVLVAMIAGGVVVIFIANYSMTIAFFVLAMFFLAAFIIPLIFCRLGRESAKKIVKQIACFKIAQIEALQGMTDLCAFNAYSRFQNKLQALSEQMISVQKRNNQISALSSALIGFFTQFTLLVTIGVSSILYQQNMLSGAEVVMLCFSALAVFELVTSLSAIQMLPKTQVAASRVRKMAEFHPVVVEPKVSLKLSESGSIKLTDLSFRYSEDSAWVLKNVSLDIPQGSKIAIVGESGAGKTTLLQLIMHFYDPQQGCIKFAGVDYKQLSLKQLTQRFAVLSQKTQLFSTTIKNNLLIAKPAASERELEQVIKKVGLSKFVENLSDGINTWIGENGIKISTGEARRVALARLYLKDSPIIILDEPTEGLDFKTEKDIYNVLEQMLIDKTLILVSHRTTGLKLVEEIYECYDGFVVKR